MTVTDYYWLAIIQKWYFCDF